MNNYTNQLDTKLHHGSIKSKLFLGLFVAFQGFAWTCNYKKKALRLSQLKYVIDNQEINISFKEGQSTWLHEAVDLGPEAIKSAIQRIKKDKKAGIKYLNDFPNTIDRNTGWTALGKAIDKGDPESVKLLLSEDLIDPNKTGRELSSLFLAFQKVYKNEENYSEIIKYLLDSPRIDITIKHPDTDESVLHIAIPQHLGWLLKKLVRQLWERGYAHILVEKDKKGRTPIDIAHECNNRSAFLAIVLSTYTKYDTGTTENERTEIITKVCQNIIKLIF